MDQQREFLGKTQGKEAKMTAITFRIRTKLIQHKPTKKKFKDTYYQKLCCSDSSEVI